MVSPSGVVRVLQQRALKLGELWTMFKECGGVTKEAAPSIDESEQIDVLVRLWSELVVRE